VILSDPDLAVTQGMLNFRVSLSDYANRKFVPDQQSHDAVAQRALSLLRGADVASVDVGIILNIARLAKARLPQVKTRTARSLQLRDFQTTISCSSVVHAPIHGVGSIRINRTSTSSTMTANGRKLSATSASRREICRAMFLPPRMGHRASVCDCGFHEKPWANWAYSTAAGTNPRAPKPPEDSRPTWT
jgi:hypothetical protein